MYKGTIWMMPLLLLASFTADAFAQQTEMTQNIPYTDTPPVIDGEVDEIYPTEGDGVFPMLNGRSGYEAGVDSLNLWATAYTMWDEDYLYVIAVVVDDIPVLDAPDGGSAWQDDSIELYIDGLNEKCESCYDDNDTQYRFRPGVPEGEPAMLFAANNQTEEGIDWTTGVDEAGGGYRVELALPWTKNSVPAQTNGVIGFDVHVNDADDVGATRSGKLHWSDSPGDNQYQYADYYGTAILVGGGGANQAVAIMRRTPSGAARVGVEVEFDGTSSTAPGTITSYEWDFGDGTTGSGDVVTHTYDEIGEYTVTLTVTDDGDVSGTTESSVAVYTALGTPGMPLEIPMAPSAPVIDGVMDAAYEVAQVASIENRANGSDPTSEADLSVSAYLMWDADNLYVLYDVTDDTLSNDSGSSWEDDTPEIYIDGGNEKRSFADGGYDENDLQYEFGWNATTPTGNSPNEGNVEGVEYAFVDKEDGSGYLLEAVVPWARSAVTPTVGLEIGFELMVNDDDSPEEVVGTRQTKSSWFAPDGQDVAYQDPSAFGTAVLVEELGTAAENPSEVPGSFSIESVYPNPFNPSTTALLNVEQPGDYAVTVYNVLGQSVHKQALAIQATGRVSVSFDLRGQASGMYFFAVQNKATGTVATSSAMLLK